MGLLDILGAGTPQANALGNGLLGMGAGLLQGGAYGALGPSLGKGLLGFQQGQQNERQNEMQQQYLGARSSMLQQQLALAKQRQNAAINLLGIGGEPSSPSLLGTNQTTTNGFTAPSGATAYPVATSGVASTPSAPSTATPTSTSEMSPAMRRAIAADLMFNNGQGVAGLLKPNIKFVNGVAVDMNNVKDGFSVPTVNTNGMATQLTRNADGTWNVSAPGGAVRTYRSFQDAQQDAQSSHDLVEFTDDQGNKRYAPKSAILNSASNGNGAPMASRNPADVAYDTDVAKTVAAQYNSIQSAGLAASTKIAEYEQLDNLLANTDLSKTGYEIANFASKNGLLPTSASNSLGNAQAATALSNRLALTLRSTAEGGGMPGSMSDPDRQFLMQQVPQLETTPEGRRQMIGMLVDVEKRNQQVAQMARDWRKGTGRLDRADVHGKTFFDYLQGWSDKNPLFAKLQNDTR